MADKKISALTAATTPLAGTEVLPIVQSSATVKVSVANLTAGRAISATQLTLTTGNLIVASGQGIDFSATSHPAGMTSELLSDYEEGTFTATLTSATPPTTPPTTTARYTKIGRLVSVQIDFTNVDTTGGLGAMNVTGLPFAASASSAYSSVGAVAKYQLGATVSAAAIPTAVPTTLEIVDANNTTLSAIVPGTGKYLFISITYTV